MSASFKIWIGIAIALVGSAVFAYGTVQFSNGVASKGPVFSESDVPSIADNMKTYLPLEAASVGIIAVGIAIAAMGHSDSFASTDIIPSKHEMKGSKSKAADAT